jgi:GR25 family glycosyltransferase involved in LPS biosynthesis
MKQAVLATLLIITLITLTYFSKKSETYENIMTDYDGYIISLSDDLYISAAKNISKTGIVKLHKFNAIPGNTLSDFVKDRNNLTIKAYYDIMIPNTRNSHSDLGTINAVGCYMSHVNLWKKVVDENLIGMYIFESDAVCGENLKDYTDTFLLTSNPHLLLFGYIGPDSGSNKIKKINHRFYGTHSYFITYEGAKILLKYAFPIEEQVDSYISDLIMLSDQKLIEELNVYSTKNICIQNNPKTTIQTKPVIKQ